MNTIAALATAQGTSAIAVIRISGSETFNMIDQIFSFKKSSDQLPLRTAILGKITNKDELIDQVILTLFKAPFSYTGEDSAEIACHGGMTIIEKILNLLYSLGIKSAAPGEFTYRAFLNGKLDLIQAEAVEDLIRAENDKAIKAAHSLLEGRLSAFLKSLKQKLINEASNLEALIEFPEEEEVQQTLNNINTVNIDSIITDIKIALDSFEEGFRARTGYRVILFGSPNTGKSTLLNAILGYNRAIVSEKAGTTRDYISEKIFIHGQTVTITDMAGIRETEEEIEKAGIGHSIEMIQEASLVFHIIDCSREQTSDDTLSSELLEKKADVVHIITKTDLPFKIKEHELPAGHIKTSAINSSGINEIKEKIAAELFKTKKQADSNNLMITHLRHKEGLEKALQNIEQARINIINNDIEIAALDLHLSFKELQLLLGETTPDDILNNIFSNFCIGK